MAEAGVSSLDVCIGVDVESSELVTLAEPSLFEASLVEGLEPVDVSSLLEDTSLEGTSLEDVVEAPLAELAVFPLVVECAVDVATVLALVVEPELDTVPLPVFVELCP